MNLASKTRIPLLFRNLTCCLLQGLLILSIAQAANVISKRGEIVHVFKGDVPWMYMSGVLRMKNHNKFFLVDPGPFYFTAANVCTPLPATLWFFDLDNKILLSSSGQHNDYGDLQWVGDNVVECFSTDGLDVPEKITRVRVELPSLRETPVEEVFTDLDLALPLPIADGMVMAAPRSTRNMQARSLHWYAADANGLSKRLEWPAPLNRSTPSCIIRTQEEKKYYVVTGGGLGRFSSPGELWTVDLDSKSARKIMDIPLISAPYYVFKISPSHKFASWTFDEGKKFAVANLHTKSIDSYDLSNVVRDRTIRWHYWGQQSRFLYFLLERESKYSRAERYAYDIVYSLLKRDFSVSCYAYVLDIITGTFFKLEIPYSWFRIGHSPLWSVKGNQLYLFLAPKDYRNTERPLMKFDFSSN